MSIKLLHLLSTSHKRWLHVVLSGWVMWGGWLQTLPLSLAPEVCPGKSYPGHVYGGLQARSGLLIIRVMQPGVLSYWWHCSVDQRSICSFTSIRENKSQACIHMQMIYKHAELMQEFPNGVNLYLYLYLEYEALYRWCTWGFFWNHFRCFEHLAHSCYTYQEHSTGQNYFPGPTGEIISDRWLGQTFSIWLIVTPNSAKDS